MGGTVDGVKGGVQVTQEGDINEAKKTANDLTKYTSWARHGSVEVDGGGLASEANAAKKAATSDDIHTIVKYLDEHAHCGAATFDQALARAAKKLTPDEVKAYQVMAEKEWKGVDYRFSWQAAKT